MVSRSLVEAPRIVLGLGIDSGRLIQGRWRDPEDVGSFDQGVRLDLALGCDRNFQ